MKICDVKLLKLLERFRERNLKLNREKLHYYSSQRSRVGADVT